MKHLVVTIFTIFIWVISNSQTRNLVLVNKPTDKPTNQVRKAIVIGESNYGSDRTLNNTLNDADAVNNALRKLGFEVTLVKDTELKKLRETLNNWFSSIALNDMAIFYFAGHGMEVNGENYLIPVGAELATEADVSYNAINVNWVLSKMDEQHVNMKMLVLDACRNNPFKRSWTRGIEKQGLTGINAPEGTFVAFAAAPGQTAQDGGNYGLKNGVFTHFLVQELAVPGKTIDQVFNNVNKKVIELTGKIQVPFKNSSLAGDFIFIPSKDIPVVPNTQPKEIITYYYYIDQSGNENAKHFPSKKDAETFMKLNKVFGKIYSNNGEVFIVDGPIVPNKPNTSERKTNIADKLKQAAEYYNNKIYDRAFEIYNALKEEEMDSNALFNLGKIYNIGKGVTQDYNLAKFWYQKAADMGHAMAMNNLGVLYILGLGVTQDYTQAKFWYQKAADLGNSKAMANLGGLYQNGKWVTQDYNLAKFWYQKAANLSDTIGMINLGFLYNKGLGVTQDYTQAKFWYQKAADLGSTNGMINLGFLYDKGLGVTQDYTQAKFWYQKAADLGNSKAMVNLGIFYHLGRGVTQDYTQAKFWYQKAADLGDTSARTNLGKIYNIEKGVTKDHTQSKYFIGQETMGGIVFYIDKDGQHGLIVAKMDVDNSFPAGTRWGNVIVNTSSEIGQGSENTKNIKIGNIENSSDCAACRCNDLNLNGYTDWFLPSIDEFNEMYKQKNIIPNIELDKGYWSSTTTIYTKPDGTQLTRFAWVQRFDGSGQTKNNIFGLNMIRAIRRF